MRQDAATGAAAAQRPVRRRHRGDSAQTDGINGLQTSSKNNEEEVDLEEALPRHLCRVVPDLAAVQITAPDAKQPRFYKCP